VSTPAIRAACSGILLASERAPSNSPPLDLVLARVHAEQRAAQSDEAKLARLRREAPDLVDLVEEDRMKLSEAFAALEERDEQIEPAREHRGATKEERADRVDIVNSSKGGKSALYTLKRLKRDRPDLFHLVIGGAMSAAATTRSPAARPLAMATLADEASPAT
jgi:hypothetical protein